MLKQVASRVGLAAIAVAAISTGGMWETTAVASDHSEAPLVKEDSTVDLTDLYVFESGGGKTTLIACWDGLSLPGGAPPFSQDDFNPDALFAFHIDNAGPDGELDGVADLVIYWRYGQNNAGDWGIQWQGIPGSESLGEFVVGPVESVFEAGDGTSVWTGKADDPFFFDALGYLDLLNTGELIVDDDPLTLAFDNTADSLAGANVKAAAIELDTELLQDADEPGPIQVWITSARKD